MHELLLLHACQTCATPCNPGSALAPGPPASQGLPMRLLPATTTAACPGWRRTPAALVQTGLALPAGRQRWSRSPLLGRPLRPCLLVEALAPAGGCSRRDSSSNLPLARSRSSPAAPACARVHGCWHGGGGGMGREPVVNHRLFSIDELRITCKVDSSSAPTRPAIIIVSIPWPCTSAALPVLGRAWRPASFPSAP